MKEINELDISLTLGRSNLIDTWIRKGNSLDKAFICKAFSSKDKETLIVNLYDSIIKMSSFNPKEAVITLLPLKGDNLGSIIEVLNTLITKATGELISLTDSRDEHDPLHFWSGENLIAESVISYVENLNFYKIVLLILIPTGNQNILIKMLKKVISEDF